MAAAMTMTAAAATMMMAAGCGGSARDVVAESRDVRGVDPHDAPAPQAPKDGYEFVARRPLASVALAEGRGLSRDLAERATNTVADALQRCASDLVPQRKLVRGAARVVALIGADGNLTGLQVKVAPGADVAANAILCFIAPIKSLTFPASNPDAGSLQRGIALEAAWGP
ncbi:hypothetical protein [Pendulispora albinea]|uniref:Lipoprotein n=1 Tax=Pendulispora albinea TaxID=2741071 RepID=A0ABZ2M350_9BACT